MWAFYFGNSNYQELYKEYEQLIDAFHWDICVTRKLSFRERKHWIARWLYKLEQEYSRMHQLNNQNQVVTRSVGQEVTFSGIRYR